ncbi:hypothetical protein O181_072880 [Austropuccinia psidii MF-1]|uniref:Uncharacterized protein n=1 Tax=Austropuccinia psidii MF-1 TaxID=1389203 RepID=A0A9Q3F9G9_9BASI|nr:hypothetical protein [Austropuccinia psidii MF-1]
MSPVHLRELGSPRVQPGDRPRLSRTEEKIHISAQQRPQTRVLVINGSISSSQPIPDIPAPMEHRKAEIKAIIPLGRD